MLFTSIRSRRFHLGKHEVTSRIVPLLDGTWLYHSQCSCTGSAIHGRAEHHRYARRSYRLLPCYPRTSQVATQGNLAATAAARLIAECGVDSAAVNQPYAKLKPPMPRRPYDVAVDASVRRDVFAVAAVTGRGWLKVYREPFGQPHDSTAAEVFAVCAGLELMPVGNRGTLWCDNQSVVDMIGRWRRFGFSGRCPDWLSHMTFCLLANLLSSRQMNIRWRPRNSTPMLQLADRFSKLGAAPEFDGVDIAGRTTWVRRDEENTPGELVEYCYGTTDGMLSTT